MKNPVDENNWHYGPEFSYELFGASSVQLENTFLIVGGGFVTGFSDIIWMFDVESEDWIALNQTLETARCYSTAFLVPDEFC